MQLVERRVATEAQFAAQERIGEDGDKSTRARLLLTCVERSGVIDSSRREDRNYRSVARHRAERFTTNQNCRQSPRVGCIAQRDDLGY